MDRRSRILVDTGRSDYSATFAAAYTVRARPGAPVSAPAPWEEVERGEVAPRSFTIRNMAQRVENVGDLWSDLLKTKRSLRLPIERLEKMLGRTMKALPNFNVNPLLPGGGSLPAGAVKRLPATGDASVDAKLELRHPTPHIVVALVGVIRPCGDLNGLFLKCRLIPRLTESCMY